MPFIRKVRVLFKTRLIFPRINGPNVNLVEWVESAGNRRGFDLKSIPRVEGLIVYTCSEDGAFDFFFGTKTEREY